MKTITALAANKLGKFLARDFRRIFGPAHDDVAERLASLARSTIECLGRSDALYHNFEHTLQVTMVGRDILRGMTLSQRIEPADYDHLIVACLLHDIGYMRGVLNGDTETEFVVDGKGKKITLPRGASDAALAPYHVDRSKLFAFERLGKSPTIDAARIADAIEMTRFPARNLGGANENIEPKGKYPPAEPGALGIGPLEAAVRVANATLHSLATRRWPINATNSFAPSGCPLAPVF